MLLQNNIIKKYLVFKINNIRYFIYEEQEKDYFYNYWITKEDYGIMYYLIGLYSNDFSNEKELYNCIINQAKYSINHKIFNFN